LKGLLTEHAFKVLLDTGLSRYDARLNRCDLAAVGALAGAGACISAGRARSEQLEDREAHRNLPMM
jgi:hypothetical protein